MRSPDVGGIGSMTGGGVRFELNSFLRRKRLGRTLAELVKKTENIHFRMAFDHFLKNGPQPFRRDDGGGVTFSKDDEIVLVELRIHNHGGKRDT